MTDEEFTQRDAKNRAVRSFFWGLFIDLSTAVVLILVTAFTTIEWTREYWAALGLMLVKSLLQSAVAYFARKLFPPLKS